MAEGLYRAALGKASSKEALSAPEFFALQSLRYSFANLLKRLEWNGIMRTRDAEKIIEGIESDRRHCRFLTAKDDFLLDWIVQILTAE